MVDVNQFRNAMALLGGAVSVITTDGPAGRFGFTASAVCSVTDAPPTLLVCMNRASYSNEQFKANGALCVNVLSGEQEHEAKVFAGMVEGVHGEARFQHGQWRALGPVRQSGWPQAGAGV